MKASRRIMLKNAAIVAGFSVAPWAVRPAAAQQKAAKPAMQYQEQPKNGQKCSECLQFIPGQQGANGTCKVVEGPISPNGWCAAFVKKS
jgi:High potential iron-sulfur protein